MGPLAAPDHRHAGYAPYSSLRADGRDQLQFWVFGLVVGSVLRHLPCGACPGSGETRDRVERLPASPAPGRTFGFTFSRRSWTLSVHWGASSPYLKEGYLMRSHPSTLSCVWIKQLGFDCDNGSEPL